MVQVIFRITKLDFSGKQVGHKTIWHVSITALGAQAVTSLTYLWTESNFASPPAQNNCGTLATNRLIVLYHLSGSKDMAMYDLVAAANCNFFKLLTNFRYTAI